MTIIEEFRNAPERAVRLRELREKGQKDVSKFSTSVLKEAVNADTGEITTHGQVVYCLAIGV